MRYPCLVPKRLCRTDIELRIDQEGRNQYGEPLPEIQYLGKCNYQDKAKTIFTADKKLIEITGTALLPGDICPRTPHNLRRKCGHIWGKKKNLGRS